jgi:glycosyltransferase involved in cell wall biosynthesis
MLNWSSIELKMQSVFPPKFIRAWAVRSTRKRSARHPSLHHKKNGVCNLYVDVSIIGRHDAGTGIQRVVRAIASELLRADIKEWRIQPVAADRKHSYRAVTWGGAEVISEYPIHAKPGDVFLGLDFALDDVYRYRKQLQLFRQQGGRLWFVMYDLLPQIRPDWFSNALVVRYRKWLNAIASMADGFFCISPPVEDDLRMHLRDHFALYLNADHFAQLPMGADFNSGAISKTGELISEREMQAATATTFTLMVGTLEPRKGHVDILNAFTQLWSEGDERHLVIVGRPGWKTEHLQSQIRNHIEFGRKLFWFSNAADESLQLLYQGAAGVIAASHAEGFGLPLIEALHHDKPVLARDIAVFRMHDDPKVQLFPIQATTDELAASIVQWFSQSPAVTTGGTIEPNMTSNSWQAAALQICKVLKMKEFQK